MRASRESRESVEEKQLIGFCRYLRPSRAGPILDTLSRYTLAALLFALESGARPGILAWSSRLVSADTDMRPLVRHRRTGHSRLEVPIPQQPRSTPGGETVDEMPSGVVTTIKVVVLVQFFEITIRRSDRIHAHTDRIDPNPHPLPPGEEVERLPFPFIEDHSWSFRCGHAIFGKRNRGTETDPFEIRDGQTNQNKSDAWFFIDLPEAKSLSVPLQVLILLF